MEMASSLINSATAMVANHPVAFSVGLGMLAAGAIWKGVNSYRRHTLEQAYARATHITPKDYPERSAYDRALNNWIDGQKLTSAAAEVIARGQERPAVTLLNDFINTARGNGFNYNPQGVDCEIIAKTFMGICINCKIVTIGGGKNRVIVNTPNPIDRKWKGGPVFGADGRAIPGWAGFMVHYAVKVDGQILDPTGGYVGAEDGWYRLLTNTGADYALTPLQGRQENSATVQIGEASSKTLLKLKAKQD